jgi:hypothetical protein
MARMRITPPDLAALAPSLHRDGFVLAPSGLEPEALDEVTAGIEAALRAADAEGRGAHALRDVLSLVPEAPAGGLLVMRPLLVHASSAATRPGRRRVLHLDFAREALPAPLRWRMSARIATA